MRIFHFNQKTFIGKPVMLTALVFLIVLGAFGMMMLPAFSEDKETTPGTEKDRIRVSADSLMVDNANRYAEFSGNVKAVQGNTEIKSDRLRIHYKAQGNSKEKSPAGEDAIEKITAEGNVVIKFDNKIAETEHAVYTAADRLLTLTGANSKVMSGNDFITGSKIILYRNDGRIKVEGNSQKPVEAVISSGSMELK